MTTAAPPRTTSTTNNDTHDQDRDTALLADYWDPTLTLFDISARNNISLPDLDAWCQRPDVVEALDLTARMDAERSRRLIALAQSAAAGALVRATSANSPETARRAASALTRLNHQAHRNTAPPPEPQQPRQQHPGPNPNQPKPISTTQESQRSRTPDSPQAPAPALAQAPTPPRTPAANLIAQAGTAPTPPHNTHAPFTQPTLEEDIIEALQRLRHQPKPPQRAAAA
jgi:hypothetical protein